MNAPDSRIKRRIRPRKPSPPVLNRREARLRMLAEYSPDVYFAMRFPEGRYEYISPTVEALFGHSQQEFYDDAGTVLRCVAPEWRDRVQGWLQEITRGEVAEAYEFQVLNREGLRRWMRQRQVYVPTPDGTAWLLQGVATDITELREAQQKLSDSEEHFRQLIELWPDQVMLSVNLDTGRHVYVSPSMELVMGYAPQEFYDDPGLGMRVVAPQWQEQAQVWMAEIHRGLLRPSYEFELVHKNGQHRWIHQVGVLPLPTPDHDRLVHFTFRDITELKKSELALRESNQRYALLSDNLVDVIWALDTSLRWTYLSPSAEILLGAKTSIVSPRPLEQVFPPESLARVHEAVNRWKNAAPGTPEDAPRWLNIEIYHSSGELVPTEVLARSVRNENGIITGYCGTTRDIRPRKRMERIEAALSRLARELLECEVLGQTLTLAAACAREITGAAQVLAGHRNPETGLLQGADGQPLPGLLPAGALGVPVLNGTEEVGRLVALDAPLEPAETRQLLERAAALLALAVTRMRAEEALRKSERLSRMLLESMHEGVWAVDRDHQTTFVNEHLSAMLGYSVHELMAIQPLDLLDIQQRQRVVERMQERRLGRSGSGDYDLLRKDGLRLPVHVSASPILDKDGVYDGLVCTIMDLSERQQMEEKLRRNQARFEALFELSRLTTATEAQMATYTLREALRLTGSGSGVLFFVSADSARLEPLAWLGAQQITRLPSFPTGGSSPWAMVFSTRQPLVLNDFSLFSGQLPAGHQVVDRFLGVPALDGDRPAAILGLSGKTGGYSDDDSMQVSLLLDGMWRIVRTRRDEERIRASLREKESLLREVHHRVKNNLQVVSSLLDMAGRRLPDASSRRSMEEVRTKVQAMSLVHAQLHRDAVSGGPGIDLERYVHALFQQLREIYSGDMELSLEVLLDQLVLGLDQAAPLGLALNEVLANVFKHGRREGRPGRVAVRAWQEPDGEVCIEVCDDGPGLPPDLVPERARSLGMKLMFGLVRQQLGGALSLQSGPQGVCVRISFRRNMAT